MKAVHHLLNVSTFSVSFFSSTLKFIFDKVSLYKGNSVKAILIGLIISLIVTALARIGYFKLYQNPLTNLLHFITQKKANDVVLLFITEEEYKEGFHGISPLSRGRLAEMVDLMVKLQAKVIALDIDISDPSSEDRKLSDALARSTAAGIPVVVAANFKVAEDKPTNNDSLFDLRPYTDERLHTTKDGLILFEGVSPGSQWAGKVIYGGTVFRLDSDWVFRMADAFYMIRNNGSKYKLPYFPVPSFPIAVAAAYRGILQETLMEALLNIQESKEPRSQGGALKPKFLKPKTEIPKSIDPESSSGPGSG